VIDSIDVNVTGRLMLLLSKQGVLDNRCLSIYKNAVCDVVRKRLVTREADGYAGIDRILDEELALLEAPLKLRARERASAAADAAVESPERPVAESAPSAPTNPLAPPDSQAAAAFDVDAVVKAAREARASSGYVPHVKSMEEKLKDERKPVQTLLKEDCVRIGLVDRDQAETMILGMTGKTGATAEHDIVEQLRQTLQDQVKSFIRHSKGGPWSDPRTQEELRKDIHAAKSVRSILMLARQVTKEYQTWRDEHRRGGILGLFSPRKRIVQS